MFRVLFILITIMAAVLGIMNQHLCGSNIYSSDNTADLIETLLQRMYINSSSPYESNITDFIGPKYEALLGKPLLQMLERKEEDTTKEKGQDTVPKSAPLSHNVSIHPVSFINSVAKTRNLDKSSNSNELETISSFDNEARPFKKGGTLNENIKEHIRENLKENLSQHFRENLGPHFRENVGQHFKENLKEHQKENSREKVKENLDDDSDKSLSRQMKNEKAERLEPNFKAGKELQKETESFHNIPRNNFTQQKLKELAELEKVLKYFTQLMEQQPAHISSPKVASSNSTVNAEKVNETLNETADTSQTLLSLVQPTPSTNVTVNSTEVSPNVPANITNDSKMYKPQSKNLTHYMRTGATLNNGSSDLTVTDQNIELFQNWFSYRKIPYPVLSLYPLLANWSQAVSSMNSSIHSGKTKPKHSWIHSGLTNNSFHIKNPLIEPISRVQIQLEKPTNQKLPNNSNCYKAVEAVQTSHVSILPTLVTSRPAVTHFELVRAKITPLPHFNSHSGDLDPVEILRRCWIELNKTKSEIKLHETTQQEAITCIIPRQNTSIFYGPTAEPQTRETSKSNCFCKLFNKKKKKATPCATVPSFSSMNVKEHTRPMISSTHGMQAEHERKIDSDRSRDHEIYDEGIDKILEEVSSKMCLPNMINRLLDLVCQNGTNCSTTWEHRSARNSPHKLSDSHRSSHGENHRSHNHDHIHNHHDHTISATRLGANQYKTRWENHSYPESKFNENKRRLKKSYPITNKSDRDSLRETKQKLRSEGTKANRDLRDLLFLIGTNKNRDMDESSFKSKRSYGNYKIDTAYIQI